MNDFADFRSNEWHQNGKSLPNGIPDHADALASILERCADRLRANGNAEDLARELLPIIRVAARYC